MYFRKSENTFTFVSAQAIAQLVYLRRAQDDGETPKTGLVAVLGTAETVFGVSGCFRSLFYGS